MNIIINRIITEFNKIYTGQVRVYDSLHLGGKLENTLDVKNAATAYSKQENQLNVGDSAHAYNAEKLRSVNTAGQFDVNANGEPVFKTEQNLKVLDAQTLQDVEPGNLHVDVARRLKTGSGVTERIFTVDSLMDDVALRRVLDSAALGGKTEEELYTLRARDADDADLLNNTPQDELVVLEAAKAIGLKRNDGTTVIEENLYVKSSDAIRYNTNLYTLPLILKFVVDSESAKSIYVDFAAVGNKLQTASAVPKTWEQLKDELKTGTASEIYKAKHFIVAGTPKDAGDYKTWVIDHTDFTTKVGNLNAKTADRTPLFGSVDDNISLSNLRTEILATKVTLAADSALLNGYTAESWITTIRNRIFTNASSNLTDAEIAGLFGNSQMEINIKPIVVNNALNSGQLEGNTVAQIKAQIEASGVAETASYLQKNPGIDNAGITYQIILDDIATAKSEIVSTSSDEYQTLKKIEDIVKANKLAADNARSTEVTNRTNADNTLQSNIDSEASTRATNDNTLQTNIDNEATTRSNTDSTLNSNIITEKNRIDTIVNVNNGEPDTFAEVNTVTDGHNVRITDNEDAIIALESSSSSSSVSLGNEIDKIETSVGLNSDGTVTLPNGNYMSSASSIMELSVELDTALATEANKIATINSNVDGSYNTLRKISNKVLANTSAISDEESRIDTILNNAPSDCNTFKEVDDKINGVSSDLTNAISVLKGDAGSEYDTLGALEDRIQTEASSRGSADTTLQSNINTEESERKTTDGVLTDLNTDNKTNLVAAINELDTHTDNNSTAVSNMNTIVTAHTSSISTLETDVADNMPKAGNLYQDAIKTTNGDVLVGTRYYIDISVNEHVDAKLPNSPDEFEKVLFNTYKGTYNDTTGYLKIQRNGNTIMGVSEDLYVKVANETVEMVYISGDWRVL